MVKKKVGKKSEKCLPKGEGILIFLRHIHDNPSELDVGRLGQICHISERGVYRYLNTLTRVGIPVKLLNGGYTLLDDSWKEFVDAYHPGKADIIKELVEIGMSHCNDPDVRKFGEDFLCSLTKSRRGPRPSKESVK